MTLHELKLNERWFDAVKNGIKRFELRRDDRGFEVGDTLRLFKVSSEGKYYTIPNHITCDNEKVFVDAKVLYILRHEDFQEGIPEGYCVLSIEVIE